ncbi:hypothetical protein V6N12_062449 [Hibiscus sabdariffa]|uniref:RNase H type-1 domain-containing protein n=1 Tax=Hibiscus sabdariffa TaxID=183260 RepID=A0ABR2F950_9ROSI
MLLFLNTLFPGLLFLSQSYGSYGKPGMSMFSIQYRNRLLMFGTKGYFGLVAMWRVSSRLSFDLLNLVPLTRLALNQGLGFQDFRKLLVFCSLCKLNCGRYLSDFTLFGIEALFLFRFNLTVLRQSSSLKADNAYMSPISLVRAIVALRQKAWATEITWIPRASNLPAGMLAKSVDPSSTNFHELAEPPVALMPLMSMDALHLSL